MRVIVPTVFLAAQLICADWAHAWETLVTPVLESSDPVAIDFDRRGNVFVAITGYQQLVGDGSMTVLSIRGDSGAERWQQWIPQRADVSDGGRAFGMKVDSRGDVFAVGYTGNRRTEDSVISHEASVVKLNGRTGAIVWHPVLGPGIAWHVELDRNGDAFVTIGESDMNVLKLSGSDGSILWSSADLPFSRTFALDRQGNVLIGMGQGVAKLSGRDGRELWRLPAGYVSRIESMGRKIAYSVEDFGSGETRVVARDIEHGNELWHHSLPGTLINLAIPSDGSAVLAVSMPEIVRVSVHERANGEVRWQRDFPAPPGRFVLEIGAAANGTVAVLWSGSFQIVQSLAADSGRLRWQHEFTGLYTSPRKVEFDRRGNVVVAGDDVAYTPDNDAMSAAYVAKLSRGSGRSVRR